MRTLMWTTAALVAGLAVVCPVRADEAAKKVVEKAIKAHGGAELLQKQKDKGVIQKGKMHLTVMGLDIDGTIEITAIGNESKNYKFRQDLKFSIMGQDIDQVIAFDGKQVWVTINGMVAMTIDSTEDLAALKDAAFAEEAASLVLLQDKDTEVSIIGEDKVDDIPVVGIRVSKKGHKDVSLYFEKESGLLKKVQNRSLDFQSRQEVEQVRILSNYKEINGQMHPMKVVVHQDGNPLIEIEFTDVKLVDSIDDSTFAKPKD